MPGHDLPKQGMTLCVLRTISHSFTQFHTACEIVQFHTVCEIVKPIIIIMVFTISHSFTRRVKLYNFPQFHTVSHRFTQIHTLPFCAGRYRPFGRAARAGPVGKPALAHRTETMQRFTQLGCGCMGTAPNNQRARGAAAP